MKTGLPSGLQGLLAKIGIAAQKAGEGAVSQQALQVQGEGKEAKGTEKGAALGDGALLAGLGYSAEDRQGALKNVAEKANIDRFMQDPSAEVKELQQALRDMKDAEPLVDRRDARDGVRDEKDAGPREGREDLRRDEKREEVREGARETKEQRERETAEAKEQERQRDRDEQSEDEEKHGAGWVQEEQEEEPEQKKRRGALRESDVMGEHARCRGNLEDGTRCLRKPVSGTPYCRAHALGGG